MNTSTLSSALLAELALGFLPFLALVGVGMLLYRRPAARRRRVAHAAAPPMAFAGELTPRSLLVRSFATGLAIDIATLLPLSFEIVVLVGSFVFGLAMAVWAWRSVDGISGAFFAVAGAMLGATLVETIAACALPLTNGTPDNPPALALLMMWLLFALPGLAFGLVGGWMAGTLDREQEAQHRAAVPQQAPPVPLHALGSAREALVR